MKRYWKIICWTCLGATVIGATTLATVFAVSNKYQQNSNISNTVVNNKSPTADSVTIKKEDASFAKLLKQTDATEAISLIPDSIKQNLTNSFVAVNNATKNIENKKMQEIHQYAIKVVHQIYAGKINVPEKINQLKLEFDNSLTKNQLSMLENKINQKKIEEIKENDTKLNSIRERIITQNTNLFYNYYQYKMQNTLETAHSKLQTYNNLLKQDSNDIYAFATASTVASVASAATAIAILFIPFWGWSQEGFALAATAIDISASVIAWLTFDNIKNTSQQVQNAINSAAQYDMLPTWTWVGMDTINLINDINDTTVANNITQFSLTSASDAATNTLATAAEPDVTSWYMPIIDSIGLVADILNCSVCTATLFISQTVSQLQEEIAKLDK